MGYIFYRWIFAMGYICYRWIFTMGYIFYRWIFAMGYIFYRWIFTMGYIFYRWIFAMGYIFYNGVRTSNNGKSKNMWLVKHGCLNRLRWQNLRFFGGFILTHTPVRLWAKGTGPHVRHGQNYLLAAVSLLSLRGGWCSVAPCPSPSLQLKRTWGFQLQ